MTRVHADELAFAADGDGFEPSKDQIIAQLRDELREQERLVENLEASLQHARSIGMAVGILMATAKISQADGFRLLSECSQQLNRKLRDIAPYICETGSLPEHRNFDR